MRERNLGIITLVVLSLLLISMEATAQKYKFKTFGEEHGLPQTQVRGIVKDAEGYIWVGNFKGLARFNGTKFVTGELDPIFDQITVQDMDGDELGNIYVASFSNGLLIKKQDSHEIYNVERGLMSNSIMDVEVINSEQFWLVTQKHATHVEGGSIKHYQVLDEEGNPVIINKIRVIDGVTYLGSKRGLYVLKDGQFLEESNFSDIDESVIEVFIDSAGTYWLSTENNLYWRKNGEISKLNDAIGLNSVGIDEIVEFDDTEVWLLNELTPIMYTQGSFHAVDEQIGYSSSGGTNALVDGALLWIGSYDGLEVRYPPTFLVLDKSMGLPRESVERIIQDEDGHYYLCVDSGEIIRFEDPWSGEYEVIASSPSVYAFQFSRDLDSSQLAAFSSGLYRLIGGDFVPVVEGLMVRRFLVTGENQYLVGTSTGLYKYDNGSLSLAFEDELPEDVWVLEMKVAPDGKIWIATRRHGLLMIDGDTITEYNSTNGFCDSSVWSLDFDSKGNVWLGTNLHGAFKFDGETFIAYSTENGLINNSVWQVLVDKDDNVWLGTNAGIDRFDGKNFRHFSEKDGLAAKEGRNGACLKDRDGRLFFGSGSGVSIFNKDYSKVDYDQIKVRLESVQFSGKAFSDYADYRMSHEQNDLWVSFSLSEFLVSGDAEYRHKLAGADADWSEPSKELSFSNFNLPPGDYELLIQAKVDGEWLEGSTASFSFRILPPFYQTTWFLGLIGAFVVSAIFGVFIWRSYLNEREKLILDQKVKSRTADLLSANNELQAFNEAISNNLHVPIRHIKGFAQMIQNDEKSELSSTSSDQFGRILSSVNKLSEMIGDLNLLAMAGSVEIKSQLVDFSLHSRMIIRERANNYSNSKISTVIEPELKAFGTEKLLMILLESLISNAWKATSSRENVIEIGSQIVDGVMTYFVKDSGIGFKVKHQDEVFVPFVQIHKPNEYPRGSGLGLVTAQRIIHRHGGKIWVNSEPNIGTTVYFTIPDAKSANY